MAELINLNPKEADDYTVTASHPVSSVFTVSVTDTDHFVTGYKVHRKVLREHPEALRAHIIDIHVREKAFIQAQENKEEEDSQEDQQSLPAQELEDTE